MPKPNTECKINSLIKAHIREVVSRNPRKECVAQLLTYYDFFNCMECRMWEVCSRFVYHSQKEILK